MRKSMPYILTILLLNFFSCADTKQEKAYKVFNQGVAYSLEASIDQEKGNFEKAVLLNKQAIEKFKETLKIDTDNKVARSALAHSLYLDKQFNEAIDWFEKANKANAPSAANFRELGLCEINIGQVKQGREAIENAFALDTSKEIRNITVEDLSDIGTLAFSYGKQYIANGSKETGKNYQHFAVNVLMMAYDFDDGRTDILKKITQYANEIPDKTIADKYRNR